MSCQHDLTLTLHGKSLQQFLSVEIAIRGERVVQAMTPRLARTAARPEDDWEGQIPHQTTTIVEEQIVKRVVVDARGAQSIVVEVKQRQLE